MDIWTLLIGIAIGVIGTVAAEVIATMLYLNRHPVAFARLRQMAKVNHA